MVWGNRLGSKLGHFGSGDLSKEMLRYYPPLNLPGSSSWKRISDENLLGDLESCKILLATLQHRFFIYVRPFSGNYGTIYLHNLDTKIVNYY
jgi:hypothetical protein